MTASSELLTQQGRLGGVWVFDRRSFPDERGFFREAFRLDQIEAAVRRPLRFVQMNHSRSARGALRGLHAEHWDKLVYVTSGEVFTAVADLREGSPTFGQVDTFQLSAEVPRTLFIPSGVAHGYCVLSAEADYTYQVTDY